jgi:meckelin
MFYRIYQQINYDIFFIDWEHDKDLLINNLSDIRSQKYRGAWRGLHIANQFNILQKQRTISIPFCFCWLIMLWYYHKTKWSNYSHRVPNVNFVENSPESKILRYFITTFILFVSGITQYYLRRILQFQFPMKKMEFLDLCSVANISVFILEDSLHGYYVHGQSPLGKADTNLSDLVKFLEEEGKGKIRGRGLTEDENDDLQSYEIYLSYNMRCIYDNLYYMQTQSEITLADNADKLHNQSRLPNLFKHVPNSLNVQNIYVLSNYMNNQLKAKIENVASQSKIFIKDKTKIERFLEFPPSIDLTSMNAKELVFYRDPGINFDNVLFMGMEIEWLISVIYWWQMWTISLERYGGGAQSFALSIFLTYVCEKILFKIRTFFGEKNVAKKAVIDNRFL